MPYIRYIFTNFIQGVSKLDRQTSNGYEEHLFNYLKFVSQFWDTQYIYKNWINSKSIVYLEEKFD